MQRFGRKIHRLIMCSRLLQQVQPLKCHIRVTTAITVKLIATARLQSITMVIEWIRMIAIQEDKQTIRRQVSSSSNNINSHSMNNQIKRIRGLITTTRVVNIIITMVRLVPLVLPLHRKWITIIIALTIPRRILSSHHRTISILLHLKLILILKKSNNLNNLSLKKHLHRSKRINLQWIQSIIMLLLLPF